MYLIKEPNCGVFKLTALFSIGRVQEQKRGQAQALASIYNKSTRLRSNEVLHSLIDRLGMQIDVHCSAYYFQLDLYCSSEVISESVPIFFEILFDNKPDKDVWNIARNQLIESINLQKKQTDYWADKLLSEHLFQFNKQIGYYSVPEDYLNIEVDDIESFYQSNIQNSIPFLFLAGDQLSQAKLIIQNELDRYKPRKEQTIDRIGFEISQIAILDKRLDESSQASIRLGKIFERNSFENFIELEIWNTYLGGYYLSELMKELRIAKGYTYGVYSNIVHYPSFSYFQISFESDKSYVEPSLEAINDLFDRLKNRQIIDFSEAIKQYYSQWSRKEERSLKELSLLIKMKKMNYDYMVYKTWVENSLKLKNLNSKSYRDAVLDFSSYSKAVVY